MSNPTTKDNKSPASAAMEQQARQTEAIAFAEIFYDVVLGVKARLIADGYIDERLNVLRQPATNLPA